LTDNIFGTRNVLEAALDWGARTFIDVSDEWGFVHPETAPFFYCLQSL
jgi:hypothetical protein